MLSKQAIKRLKIGIIGAGFSGTTLAALIHRLSAIPIEIILFEKIGKFGVGAAYQTPHRFHLLNVRASDMSAFEDQPTHFVDWIKNHQKQEHDEQFLPRLVYGEYLCDLLKHIQSDSSGHIKITLINHEVIDVIPHETHLALILKDHTCYDVDKVILATGNDTPSDFSFPVSSDIQCIHNPWDYMAPCDIPKNNDVLIVGTGLSMIDVILTLTHNHHHGKIYAISRHGLLPLPHCDDEKSFLLSKEILPNNLSHLTKFLRSTCQSIEKEDCDWRAVIGALRKHIPSLWYQSTLSDQKRFLRHVLPYWNIHRHRVPRKVQDLLHRLMREKQLHILRGRVHSVAEGIAKMQYRGKKDITHLKVNHLINCMGPSLIMKSSRDAFVFPRTFLARVCARL